MDLAWTWYSSLPTVGVTAYVKSGQIKRSSVNVLAQSLPGLVNRQRVQGIGARNALRTSHTIRSSVIAEGLGWSVSTWDTAEPIVFPLGFRTPTSEEKMAAVKTGAQISSLVFLESSTPQFGFWVSGKTGVGIVYTTHPIMSGCTPHSIKLMLLTTPSLCNSSWSATSSIACQERWVLQYRSSMNKFCCLAFEWHGLKSDPARCELRSQRKQNLERFRRGHIWVVSRSLLQYPKMAVPILTATISTTQ